MSTAQEATAKGRYQGQLDEQPDHGLKCCQNGNGVPKAECAGKEPTPMKGAEAEDERLVPQHAATACHKRAAGVCAPTPVTRDYRPACKPEQTML